MDQIDVSGHRHLRRRSAHDEVLGVQHTLGDRGGADNGIEGEALAENIAKVERDAPWQRLQAEDAQQLAYARLDLEKLPFLRNQRQVPGKCRVIDGLRVAGPGKFAQQLGAAALHAPRVAEALQIFAHVAYFEFQVQAGALLPRDALPHAVGGEERLRCRQRQLLDAPVQSLVLRRQFQTAEFPVAHDQVVRNDVEAGQFLRRRLLRQFSRGGLGESEMRQLRDHPPFALRAPAHVTGELARVDMGEPVAAAETGAQGGIVDALAVHIQCAHLEAERGERQRHPARTAERAQPLIQVQCGRVAVEYDALFGQLRRLVEADRAAHDHHLPAVAAALQFHAHQLAQIQGAAVCRRRPAPAAAALRGGDRVLETQRQHVGTCLRQRRRQRRGDALQAGFHQNAGAAPADIHFRAPGGGAAHLPQQRLLQRRLQCRRSERAARVDGDAAVGLAGDVKRDRAAQELRVRRAHAHAALAELEPSVHLRQRRPVGIDAHLVAGQLVTACHLGVGQARERQLELELQSAVARRAHVRGDSADQLVHRALPNEFQEFCGRSFGLAVDREYPVRREQVRQDDVRAGHLRAEHARFAAGHFHALAVETQVRIDTFYARPSRRVAQAPVPHPRRDLEHAVFPALERKVLEVAFQAQAEVVCVPGKQGAVQPIERDFV